MNSPVISVRVSDGSVIKLECHDALPSTARLAKEYAKLGYPDRYVVFAEGRKKLDADDKEFGETERGVFMSCILRPSIFPSQAALINSLSTVALATALEEHTTKNIGIGWVSKVYCDGKLIGDVTVEGKLDNFTSYEYIIITFSAVLTEENFPPRINDIIRKVFDSENISIPMIIAKNMLNKFFPLYVNIKNNSEFMDAYRQKFILRGQKIKYLNDGKKETCRVVDVNPNDASLEVETKDRRILRIFTPNKVIIPKKIALK